MNPTLTKWLVYANLFWGGIFVGSLVCGDFTWWHVFGAAANGLSLALNFDVLRTTE